MRLSRAALLLLLAVLSCGSAFSQQPPPRDPQALIVLQHAFAAMGATVPSDSVATGNITLVAGSKTESGTIHILTRGLDQTAEQIETPSGTRAVVYSRGRASEIEGASAKRPWLELVVTSQSPNFPLPLIAGALSNPDIALQYLGQETLDGLAVHHIRFWSAFSSSPKLQYLAEFSVKDLWVNASSGLPYRLQYNRRAARGSAPRIPIGVTFSDYRRVGSVVYPFLIQKSLNGTPWTTITIQNVSFNTGLSDTDFPIQ